MKFSTKLKTHTSQFSLLDHVYEPVYMLLNNHTFDPEGQQKIDQLKEVMKFGWRSLIFSNHAKKLPLFRVREFYFKVYGHQQEVTEYMSELEFLGRAFVILETALSSSYILLRLSPMKYNVDFFRKQSQLIPTFFVLKRRLDMMQLSHAEEQEILTASENMHADLMLAYRLHVRNFTNS